MPSVRSHIALVLSDKPGAVALERARDAGIPIAIVEWSEFPDRGAFSEAVADAVEEGGAKGVVLAGFMRVLAPAFIDRFPGRILNVHPSLLPAFPGAHAVANAIDHGVKVTGVTVHFVDEKVDNGPIVSQTPIEVLPEDTVETLHTRIQREEHRLYPKIVEAFVAGRLSVVDRRVIIS